MKWIKRIIGLSFGLSALIAVLFSLLTVYGWDKIWLQSMGSADLGAVKFENLAKGPKPNQALICPDDLCNNQDRDRVSKTYRVNAEELKIALITALEAERDLVRVDDKSSPLKLRYVQRSRWMRFPDTIRIEFFDRGLGRSTLALYSQSQVGESDFGVNLERLDRWLERISNLEIES